MGVRWKKQYGYALGFALGVPFLVHWIPNSYRVRQRFELSGNLSNPAEAPNRVLSVLSNVVTLSDDERSGACRMNETKDEMECSFGVSRGSMAKKIDRALRETLPKEFGWVAAHDIEDKIAAASKSIETNFETMGRLEAELTELKKTAAEEDTQADEVSRRRIGLETDLANRQRQLDVIREGIASGRSEKMMRVFQTKEKELSQSIQDKKKELEEVEKELVAVSAPREKRRQKESELINLRNETDLGRARIAAWSSLKQADPKSEFLPDPDSFRLKAKLTSGTVRSVRNFAHVVWSFPLGLILLYLFRRRRPDLFAPNTFSTPEEVEFLTALPYLGPVPK